MIKKQRHNIPQMKEKRRELRANLTPAEKVLWGVLRNRNFEGLKFRRQHSIDAFIVDFYCAEKRLIIEVDGKIHLKKDVAEYDKEREEALQDMGFLIMRFSNEEVLSDLSNVLKTIKADLTPDPSPKNRRGEKKPHPHA